jgi:hypothetical protein
MRPLPYPEPGSRVRVVGPLAGKYAGETGIVRPLTPLSDPVWEHLPDQPVEVELADRRVVWFTRRAVEAA